MEEFSCPSECEEGEGKEEKSCRESEKKSSGVAKFSVIWSGSACKTPLVLFRPDTILGLDNLLHHPFTGPHRLTFKISGNEYRLVRTLLLSHGFSEVSWHNARFNLYWSGTHVQMSEVRGLMPHQRVNHFPRSNVITRKDRLYQNITRMQQSKGLRHFNIIPTTFALPEELAQFQVKFRKERGTWIVKPVSSSRGRGISIINHPNQANTDEPMVVSQYIDNPLCVNGYKFDLRIYVAVTSFNPLRVYMYEEGLARFATEKYSGAVQLSNLCMHLTNYSVNKKNSQFIRCENPERDDYGSKWSLSALLRHLLREGRDVAEMMMRVEDVVIKALIAGASHISAACDVFRTHRRNCFELYGFDILIDETLRPWLLEVNLSPSLGCDAPLDLRLKSNLVADLLTLVGIPLCNPNTRETPKPPKTRRQMSCSSRRSSSSLRHLTSEEMTMVRDCREEYERRRGFVRIFPSHDSWDLYSPFLETKSRLNFVLHRELYSDKVKSSHSPVALSSVIAKRINFSSTNPPSVCDSVEGLVPLERVAVYLRKLENGPKIKPMWDSVREILSQRDASTMPIGRRMATQAEYTSSFSESLQHLISHVKKLRLLRFIALGVGLINQQQHSESKVQARNIFAAYLNCVQKRLSHEASDVGKRSVASNDTANFEVVISFLKRAASSLSSPFTLIEPNTQLPMEDRKGMLARQLVEFITLYKQETVKLAANPTEALGLPAKVVDAALLQASEKDLKKLLAAYAQHSHSSAILFGTGPTSSRPDSSCGGIAFRGIPKCSPTLTVTDQKSRRSTSSPVLPRSSRRVLSRNAVSRVLQRQSRLPKTLPPSSGGFHSHQNLTTDAGKLQVADTAERTEIIASPPPYNYLHYSEEMLQSSSLPPNQKQSLRVLTQSLADGQRQSERETAGDRLPPRGPGRGKRGRGVIGGEGVRGERNGRLLRRTLSSQSLQSVSSDVSVKSLTSVQSLSILPKSSMVGRPQSANLVSRMKDYVSPYAQPLKMKPPTGQRRSNSTTAQAPSIPTTKWREYPVTPGSCRDPILSPTDEESIADALHRLTMRQFTRQHAHSSALGRPHHSRLAWTTVGSKSTGTCGRGDGSTVEDTV